MQYYGIGRRKCSIARIWISKAVKNKLIINKKLFSNIRKLPILTSVPLNINIIVSGGGIQGQKDAIRLALARAFCVINETKFKFNLKKKGLLTQDSRIKERKKYGLKKARKASQYSKR